MAEQNNLRVCGICGLENPPDAEHCAQCGAPLAERTTLSVPEELRQALVEPPPIPGSNPPVALQRGDLALSIPGSPTPILLRGDAEVVLGRLAPGGPDPVVDFAPHHGHLLGVSRRHALIRSAKGRYSLLDLGSSNGTWLNEQKLPPHTPYPLRDGDQIRLAQLVLYVHLPRGG